MKLYFIASPYFDSDPEVIQQRFDQSTYVSTTLALAGFAAYSWVTMIHPINQLAEQVKKKITWSPIDEAFMEKCDELIIITLLGWDKSSSVKKQTDYFKSHNRKIWTYDQFSIEHDL